MAAALFFLAAAVSLFMGWAGIQTHLFWETLTLPWAEWPGIYKFLLLFDPARENVIAAWYSSMLLLVAALAFFLCFLLARTAGKGGWRLGWGFSPWRLRRCRWTKWDRSTSGSA